jgi:hypothetical protein
MTKYYFHFLDSRNVRDEVGSEHRDVESARREAVEVLAELLRGSLLLNDDMSKVMVQVTDEHNETVLIISLIAAVQVVDGVSAKAA